MDGTVYRNFITKEIDSTVLICNSEAAIFFIIGESNTPVITITGNHLIIGNLCRRVITGVTILTNLQEITLLAVLIIGELIHPAFTVFLSHFSNELTILIVCCFIKVINILFYVIKLTLIDMELFTVFKTMSLNIVNLLNRDHILTEIFSNLILGKDLLLRGFQPLAQSSPTVFTGLDAACLLEHGQPLLWRSLLLADLHKGMEGVRIERRTDGDILRNLHIADVRCAVIKAPGKRNNDTVTIFRDQIIKFEIIPGILITVVLTIVITPLVNVVSIPPEFIGEYLLLNDMIGALAETEHTMILGIGLAGRNPIAVSCRTFLNIIRNSPVDGDLTHLTIILLHILDGRQQILLGLYTYLIIILIGSGIIKIILRLWTNAKGNIL